MKKLFFICAAASVVFAFSCSKKKCVGGVYDGKTCEDVYSSACSGITSSVTTDAFSSACSSGGGTYK